MMMQKFPKILLRALGKTSEPRTQIEIARRWVETADERCPLASVWFALPEITSELDEEDQFIQPAFALSGLKAGYLHRIHMIPATSIPLTRLIKHSMQSLVAIFLLALCLTAHAQQLDLNADSAARQAALPPAPEAESSEPLTLFPHPDAARYLLTGQANIIFQAHGPFHSPYEGTNSLLGRGEYKTSLVGTVFMGAEVIRNSRFHTDAIFDIESAGGRGDSEALGLAGFTNLDVVRNPNLGSTPYIARVQLHETIGFTDAMVDTDRTPFSLATKAPERRLEIHVGKMGLPDFMDTNSIGTDSHLQFMNWTVDNNGAWDYAADTRGYTYGVMTEYVDKSWTARYGLALMPTVANGIDLDWNLRRASGQNWEFDLRRSLVPKRKGSVRVLSFVNHAHMGLYRDAINAYLASDRSSPPNIVDQAKFSAVKYGFGLNAEQELTPDFRVFFRLGWNEGKHQSFAYTEVDQTMTFGGDYSGRAWSRPNDKVGLTFVTNAIKKDHQTYLKLGGLGFLLGDGNLNYAREDIVEGYYNLHVWRGVYYALDGQFIEHPGYNQDRGPVLFESVRMHVDF
jgi:high affinity Mn2+ porin